MTPSRDVNKPIRYSRDLQRYLHRKWRSQSQTVLALWMSPGIIRVVSDVLVVGTRDSSRRQSWNVTEEEEGTSPSIIPVSLPASDALPVDDSRIAVLGFVARFYLETCCLFSVLWNR